jgi:hypothetical protein
MKRLKGYQAQTPYNQPPSHLQSGIIRNRKIFEALVRASFLCLFDFTGT